MVDNKHLKERTAENEVLPLLNFQTYMRLRNTNADKQQLPWKGPYMIIGKDSRAGFYKLKSLTMEGAPFYVHVRNLKEYRMPDGVENHGWALESALQDNSAPLPREIVAVRGTESSKRADVEFALRYDPYDDLYWVKMDEIRNEEIFVRWCFANARTGYLTARNAEEYPELFLADKEKRQAGLLQSELAKQAHQITVANIKAEQAVKKATRHMLKSLKTKRGSMLRDTQVPTPTTQLTSISRTGRILKAKKRD